MADQLDRYRSMRRFETTPEPAGDARDPEQPAATLPRFVVQEHHARRLHWDLRLEHDGVLASWAVPNGIPEDPRENRKAVHTEDHPLEYLGWEGDIPPGQYGAGSMRIWDRGSYVCERWEERKIVVVFRGERLQGRYALFQAGSPRDWMLHRMDPLADPQREPMPDRIVPMLAAPAELPDDDAGWAFEIKWDGIRALAYSEPGRLRLESRTLKDVTARWPELRALNRALSSHSAVLDGEMVAFDERGRPSFERLQQRMHIASETAARRRARELPATYVIFDLLHLDGHGLMRASYGERRARLEELDLNGAHWRTPAYHIGDSAALLEASAGQGLEGIIGKRLDSRYEPGRRSGAWIKIKNQQRQEFVIGGWMPGAGRRRDRLGALLVGYYERSSSRGGEAVLRYAGKVGTGFDDAELDRLGRLLAPLRQDSSPFAGRNAPRGAVWVRPQLVAEVAFGEWTSQGLLRHPSYQGLRDDRPPLTVTREPAPTPPVGNGARPSPAEVAGDGDRAAGDDGLGPSLPGLLGASGQLRGAAELELEGRKLALSNLDKPLYPRAGFTKGNVIDYYARVSPALLAHLDGRPLTLKRYPDGVDGPYFYEKQCPQHRPEWVRTASIHSRHRGGAIDFCLAQDLPTLIWAANLADLELHTSLSRADAIGRPTMLVFDLDPGAPADILACCAVARWLRGMFDELGLQSFPKTSGSKGLQVYVPLNHPDVTYAHTKPFARAVAETLETHQPDLVVSRMTKRLRAGKVLVDWSQNDESKTTVCVYSLRARERPTVSTPVTWDEVEDANAAQDAGHLTFEADQVLERVQRHGDLFAPVLSLVQPLPPLARA